MSLDSAGLGVGGEKLTFGLDFALPALSPSALPLPVLIPSIPSLLTLSTSILACTSLVALPSSFSRRSAPPSSPISRSLSSPPSSPHQCSPSPTPPTDEDVYCELVKFGNLLEMHVCDNVGDHLIGNVYARFDWEDEAQMAVEALNKRWYAGEFACWGAERRSGD